VRSSHPIFLHAQESRHLFQRLNSTCYPLFHCTGDSRSLPTSEAERLSAVGKGLARGNDDFLEEGSFLQKPFSRDTLVLKVGEALRI
jgi:hypothetical protein